MRITPKVPTLVALITASAMTLLPSVASASAGNSFNGSCVLSGSATYTADSLAFTSAGTCQGSVNGRPVTIYRASNTVNETGTVLRLGTGPSLPGVLNGTGTLTLTRGGLPSPVRIAFTIHQVGLGFKAEGVYGGTAIGVGVPTNLAGTRLTVHVRTLGAQRG